MAWGPAEKKAHWARKREEAWARILAKGLLHCPQCGKDKRVHRTDAARSDFYPRFDDAVPRACKACAKLAAHRSHHSAETKRKRRLKRVRERLRAKNRGSAARLRAEGREARPSEASLKVRRFLNCAVSRGKVAKPEHCSRCRNGPAPERGGYRIAGWFPPGVKVSLENVVWLCYPCLWVAKHPDEVREAEEERRELAAIAAAKERRAAVRAELKSRSPRSQALAQHVRCRPRAAWDAIHAENVAKVETERAELAAAEARHGRRYAALLGAHLDWPEPERTRRVRALVNNERR